MLIPIFESAGPTWLDATGTPRSVALPMACMLSAARLPSVPAHTRPPATVMPYVLTEGNVVVRMPWVAFGLDTAKSLAASVLGVDVNSVGTMTVLRMVTPRCDSELPTSSVTGLSTSAETGGAMAGSSTEIEDVVRTDVM